jgi:hypothetical protein
MAAAQHKLSRRALLGAACAAPFAAEALPATVHPEQASSEVETRVEGPPLALTSAWNRALSRFQRAEAAVAALEGTPDDDAFNRAADAHDRALERLLLAPAPDIAALAEKLRQTRLNQAWELPSGDALTEALEHDASRLAAARPAALTLPRAARNRSPA